MLVNDTISISELEEFYIENFSQKKIENLCINIAKTFMQNYFLDKMINNANYEKNVFKNIKKLIILELSATSKKDLEFNTLLSVYIFKKHFKLIFQFLSKYILEEVSHSNEDIIDFLTYYSLDTIIVDKIKYRVPQMKEEDGPRWNVTSMLSILKVYIKAQKQLEPFKMELDKLQVTQSLFYVDNLDPLEYNNMIEKHYNELEIKIAQNATTIDIINDSLNILEDEEELLKAVEELKEAKKIRSEFHEQKAELAKHKIKQFKITQYNQVVRQIGSIHKRMEPLEKIIEHNKNSYISMQESLIKALISKKQAL